MSRDIDNIKINLGIVHGSFEYFRLCVEKRIAKIFRNQRYEEGSLFINGSRIELEEYNKLSLTELYYELEYLCYVISVLNNEKISSFFSNGVFVEDEELLQEPELKDIDDMSAVQKWALEVIEYYNEIGEYERIYQEFEDDDIYGRIEYIENLISKIEEKKIIYIHKGNIKCLRDHHNIECVNANVPTMDNEMVKINVNYCKDCDKYFISLSEYEYYREKYGILFVKLLFTSSDDFTINPDNFATKSPLNLCGYNVSSSTNFSDEYRQKILKTIIDMHILCKSEVITYLSLFIKMNGRKKINHLAVEKWKKDLSFVRNYYSSNQSTISVDGFRQYR